VSLRIEASYVAGEFRFEAHLEVGAGLTALVGPSGSGKTTLLNLIAGVLRPKQGSIELDSVTLVSTSSRVWRPPHKRGVGYVFQETRLFPHMTVRQNLAYGQWFRRGIPGGATREDVIGLLNLGSLLARRTERLSGGEKQRVALGRALLARPRWLLFDEPLASIDQAHREEILPYLDRVRDEHSLPTIYVTHTWSEVAGRATEVVELSNGSVVFAGPAADYADPNRRR
jgi:molybdate transport system ATP-binding protein